MNQNELLMLWCKQYIDKKLADFTPPEQENPPTPFDEIYPVGSIYLSTSKTSPATLFGGTWELFNKEFSNRVSSTIGNYVTLNTTNVSEITGTIRWDGHRIKCTSTLTIANAITDTTLELFTFDLAKIGVSALLANYYTNFSDVGNAVFNYQINATGVFSTRDVIVRGSDTASFATSYAPYFTYELYCHWESIKDEFCDKFYWKRTA